jgi:nicotinic acid mononucleotide adenylyltransferase
MKNKTIGIFIGRLQPITTLHQKIISNMKYDKNYVFVIEGRASSQEKKNFLSFNERAEMLKITNPNVSAIVSPHGYIPDIIKENNLNLDNSDVYIVAGSDRINGYMYQFKREKELTYKYFADEIPRTAEDVSATKVRTALLSNDYGTYKKMIARGLDNERWFILLRNKIIEKYNQEI